ncbi:hypothetical protein CC78DRAFT_276362 [Lojkania enalia]|uniref:Uncharacterized protein n=1 Tax=Lojkania enalia TaxID=147567 RepID=A0A9P4N5K6_9PLEO|nr:hypothetical protein CC78DRAFT_276362 [Didymosphaeria enalia]
MGAVRPKSTGADQRGKAGALGMKRDKLRGRGLRCLNPLWCARAGKEWAGMGRLERSHSTAQPAEQQRRRRSAAANNTWAGTGQGRERAEGDRYVLCSSRNSGRSGRRLLACLLAFGRAPLRWRGWAERVCGALELLKADSGGEQAGLGRGTQSSAAGEWAGSREWCSVSERESDGEIGKSETGRQWAVGSRYILQPAAAAAAAAATAAAAGARCAGTGLAGRAAKAVGGRGRALGGT